MTLLKAFTKILFIRNGLKYIKLIAFIILSYFILVVFTLCFNYISSIGMATENADMQNILLRFITVLYIAVIGQIVHMYFIIMKSSVNDLLLFVRLGATKYKIRFLLFVQAGFLNMFLLPIVIFFVLKLNKLLNRLFSNNTNYRYIMNWIKSVQVQIIIAGVFCCLILFIGIYLEQLIRRLPISNSLSDNMILEMKG